MKKDKEKLVRDEKKRKIKSPKIKKKLEEEKIN